MSANPPQSTLPPTPPQQPGGWGPYGPPPTPPKKKSWPARHKFITALLAVVAVIFIIAIAASTGGGGGTSNTPTASQPSTATNSQSSRPSSSSASQSSAVAGIGTPVRDGKFEFVVTGVTHAKSVGGLYGETAQGEYTILQVSVKNIGNEPQTLADSAQYVYDSSGRKYSADSTADLTLNSNANVFFQEINPGNTIRGQIAFDMPNGTQAVKAVLHDSLFSGGVTVNLR